MTNLPPPPPDDAAMDIIRQALHGAGDIELRISPIYAFTLVSMLQLVMRHPHLSNNMYQIAQSLAEQIAAGIVEVTGSPQLGQLLEYGFDPAHDRDRDGNPIGPTLTTLDLAGLIRQAMPQIYGSDERDILAQFLGRNVADCCLVEIDLDQVTWRPDDEET